MGKAQPEFWVMILEFPLIEKLDSTAHFILNKMDLRDGFFKQQSSTLTQNLRLIAGAALDQSRRV